MKGGMAAVLLILALLSPQGGMAAEKGRSVGQAAPDFLLRDLAGKTQRLSDYKGKIVMVYFAMWCGICRSNCHEIQEVFYKRYRNKGVEVFALDYLQNGEKELTPIVKDLGLGYRTLMDDGTMMKDYNGAMALTLVIDRQGVIRYHDFYNKKKVEAVIKDLLGMRKPAPKGKRAVKAPEGTVIMDRKAGRKFRERVFYGQGKGTGAGYFIQSGRLDLNHDGYDDIVYGNPFAAEGRGEVMVRYGGKGGPSAEPDLVLRGEVPGDFFGYSISGSDLNGDGVSDLLVGAVQWRNKKAGSVYLFHGSGNGLSRKPAAVLSGLSEGEWFGFRTAAGDINGDGLRDIAVAAHLSSAKEKEAGAVYIYYGTKKGYGETPASVIAGAEALDNFGSSLEVIDLDGDGMDELLAGAPGSNGKGVDRGAVYLFYGRKERLSPSSAREADLKIEGQRSMDNLGGGITTAGDLNGDGKREVVLGTCNVNEEEPGMVHLLFSGKRSDSPDLTIRGGKEEPMFGCSVAAVRLKDSEALAVGSNAFNRGAVHIFQGAKPVMVIYGDREKGKFGITLSPAGDVNGDGRQDFIAGEPWNCERGERAGAIHLFY